MFELHNIVKEPPQIFADPDFHQIEYNIPHQLEPEVFLVHISVQAAVISHERTLDWSDDILNWKKMH